MWVQCSIAFQKALNNHQVEGDSWSEGSYQIPFYCEWEIEVQGLDQLQLLQKEG